MRMAPNGNVGITNPFPDPSARLDIVATDKGVLLPRVTLSATNVAAPVTSPATGLIVYNTATAGTAPFDVVPGYYHWNGSSWRILGTTRVIKYVTELIDLSFNTILNITAPLINADPNSSFFITVEGDWPDPPYIRINYIEARTGSIFFQVQNVSGASTGSLATNYEDMEFTITLVNP
jgi:hypothetical protein